MGGKVIVTWCLHPLVVVGIDADLVLLEVEGELTGLNGPQLVVAVQVRPPPQAAVNDVGEAFPVRHLQTAVQRPAVGGEEEEKKEEDEKRKEVIVQLAAQPAGGSDDLELFQDSALATVCVVF